MSLTDLEAEVKALRLIVEKQSKLIAQTGQRLIELSIRDTKAAIREDPAEFATNEDLVQLVGELQGQLDELEERLVRRTCNVQLEEGRIAPLLNKEGDVPGPEFPATVAEFAAMSKRQIIEYCVFYDVIVPETESSSADSAKLITDEIVEEYSQEEADRMHDELARFLGLRFRKNI